MARFYRWILVSICLFFSFVVHSEPPTISAIAPQSTPENTPTSPILFTIGDAETEPSALTLSATSSNATLVSDGDITFSGNDADRSVVITPTPGESGTTTITITVSDGTDNTSVNFVLTVEANIPPTITSIADQSTNENTPTSPIAFTI
ncbi:MAG TPA: Ig-like domain-containing protein, partial [Chryseolinea sp.]|nr:Ig-like domain-containing protein [Chryseolinea sp.]